MGGADNDLVVGVAQSHGNGVGEAAGNGQLFLIAKNALDGFALLFNGLGHLEALQIAVNRLRHLNVLRVMSVGYKRVVMEIHEDPSKKIKYTKNIA